MATDRKSQTNGDMLTQGEAHYNWNFYWQIDGLQREGDSLNVRWRLAIMQYLCRLSLWLQMPYPSCRCLSHSLPTTPVTPILSPQRPRHLIIYFRHSCLVLMPSLATCRSECVWASPQRDLFTKLTLSLCMCACLFKPHQLAFSISICKFALQPSFMDHNFW